MLKWMAKLVGGNSMELPAGIPEAWAQRLEHFLDALDKSNTGKFRKGLAADILNYVLSGDPVSVLHELSQDPDIGEQFHLTGYNHTPLAAQADVYENFLTLPVAVALRWARVLEAAVKASSSSYGIPPLQNTRWPEVLLLASAGDKLSAWSHQQQRPRGLSCALLEAMLQEDGLAADALILACFTTPVDMAYYTEARLKILASLPDYPEAVARHVNALQPHLLTGSVAQKVHMLAMLARATPATLEQLAPQLCELAVASSKQVRLPASRVVQRNSDTLSFPLRELALKGKPEQRLHALQLLHAIGEARTDEALLEFARTTVSTDKAPSVQALLTEWEAATQDSGPEPDKLKVTLPDIDWSAAACQLPPVALADFLAMLNDSINSRNESMREYHARAVARGQASSLSLTEPFDADDVQALQSYLASGQPMPPDRHSPHKHHADQAIMALAQNEGVTPVALMKVLRFFRRTTSQRESLSNIATGAFSNMHKQQGRPTLLELGCMLEQTGVSSTGLLINYCHQWGTPFASDWPDEHVWPYFAHHLDYLLDALHNTIKDYSFSRAGLFRAIATLPQPPASAINALFSLALGSGKTDRQPAQEALHNLPDKEDRIIAALADGKAETRTVAAQWLGRLRHAPALAVLEKAVAKEKNDVAKGAMLDTLQLLGQPVEKYLDRNALAAEAAKSLAKGLPKDVEFFPWEALPAVHWADNGRAVTPDILRWLIVQAVKQKSPEPNAILRKYCEMLDARDREAFGQFVLETWLREDVRPITSEVALQRAQQEAGYFHNSMTSHPQYYQNSPHFGKSLAELTAAFLPAQLLVPAGSAIGSKGLLAVAAACARERAAVPTQRYIKEWYGSRAAQGKALIAMLAWIDHPSATQLMLAIGNRFRTKSFQEEATRQAEALAERKGWTLAELADRTVPSAGFDESGLLELDFGARRFTARLLPDFKIELCNPDGKKIASLPKPRLDDDAEKAKAAKKTFSTAKKEIKSIVELQTDRLYEALCTEREWPADDWTLYLQQHPVLRHLVQRLVWAEIVDGKIQRTFRPLDDGTLTDHADNAVELAADARIGLAHDSRLNAADVTAWQQHLVDYEIKPLFQQLGKGSYALPEAQASHDVIKDFEGHLIEAFSLRGRALKLGYTRGAAEDAGWFHVYEKRFPTLGLQATIEFTGNPLPEENRTVALLNLSFASSAQASNWQTAGMPLAKIPKVLLSECYNDLRLIAADGSGYDTDWKKKSEY